MGNNQTKTDIAEQVAQNAKMLVDVASQVENTEKRAMLNHTEILMNTHVKNLMAVKYNTEIEIQTVKDQAERDIQATKDQAERDIQAAKDQSERDIQTAKDQIKNTYENLMDVQIQTVTQTAIDQTETDIQAVKHQVETDIRDAKLVFENETHAAIQAIRDQTEAKLAGFTHWYNKIGVDSTEYLLLECEGDQYITKIFVTSGATGVENIGIVSSGYPNVVKWFKEPPDETYEINASDFNKGGEEGFNYITYTQGDSGITSLGQNSSEQELEFLINGNHLRLTGLRAQFHGNCKFLQFKLNGPVISYTIPDHPSYTQLWLAGSLGLSYSTDGLVWHKSESPFLRFTNIFYVNNLWIVCGDDSRKRTEPKNILRTSQNCLDWNNKSTLETKDPIDSISFGNNIWIHKSGNDIYYSETHDFFNRTRVFTGNTTLFFDGKFFAGGSEYIASSSDGKNWTKWEGSNNWQTLATNGEYIYAGGSSSPGVNFARSTDGITWESGNIAGMISVNSIVWFSAANVWIAGGSGTVSLAVSSSDQWQSVVPDIDCVDIYVGDTLVFAKFKVGAAYEYKYSSDGVNWSTADFGESAVLAYGKNIPFQTIYTQTAQ
jgi:hypothetical protein